MPNREARKYKVCDKASAAALPHARERLVDLKTMALAIAKHRLHEEGDAR